MIDIQEFNNLFISSKKNNHVLHLKNVFPLVPKWKHFISHLNSKYNGDNTLNLNDSRTHNDVLIYNKLDPICFNLTNSNDLIFKIPYVLENMNLLNQCLNTSASLAKVMFNFVGNESLYYIHPDDHDVLSWHCIGQMEWRVYPNIILDRSSDPKKYTEAEYISYILNPGDLLFVPSGIVHQVFVTEPRVSVIYTYHLNER